MSTKKKTIAGVLTLLGGIASFVGVCMSQGFPPDTEAWAVLGTAVTVAVRLLASGKSTPGDE